MQTVTCGHTERKYHARGLCAECYNHAKYQKRTGIVTEIVTQLPISSEPDRLNLLEKTLHDLLNRVILLENKDKEATGEPWANQLYKGTPFERKITIYGKMGSVGSKVKDVLPTIPPINSAT